jgi:hypothetical protein
VKSVQSGKSKFKTQSPIDFKTSNKMRILLFIFVIIYSLSGIHEVSAQSGTLAADGLYVPRLTKTERDAVATPSNGQMIYNTDDDCFNVYQKNGWQKLCGFDIEISGKWAQKANYGGGGRNQSVGFSIGNKAYLGTGTNNGFSGGGFKNDFWEYNATNNSWTQKANVGENVRALAVGFSIGNKGYIGGGYTNSSFWEYDPATNIWTRKADISGGIRADAFGFSIDNKGYIGTGYAANNTTKKNDFFEYDPTTDIWTPKANFGGGNRTEAIGFSIGNKGYAGTGITNNGPVNDFWEYDPVTDVWTQKANFGGGVRSNAVGFSIGSKGYIGTGVSGSTDKDDFWEYDPFTDIWMRKASFVDASRSTAVGFSMGNKGYIGTGTINGVLRSDFWEFNPNSPDLTEQGNEFNGPNQLVKSDSTGNVTLDASVNIAGNIIDHNFMPLALLNNWINYDVANGYAAAGFYKDTESILRLKGLIKNGTSTPATILFTLPAGYRPSEVMTFVVVNGNSFGRVDINPSGDVQILSGGNAFLSLDGIVFRAFQ